MLKRLFFSGVIILSAISFSGCVAVVGAAAGGAGTAFWLSGKLTDEVSASYDETVAAVRSGLSDLGMDVTKETKTDDVAQIRSEYTDGSQVWIDVRPAGQNITKIDIRVGVQGDKEASSKILEQIKNYL